MPHSFPLWRFFTYFFKHFVTTSKRKKNNTGRTSSQSVPASVVCKTVYLALVLLGHSQMKDYSPHPARTLFFCDDNSAGWTGLCVCACALVMQRCRGFQCRRAVWIAVTVAVAVDSRVRCARNWNISRGRGVTGVFYLLWCKACVRSVMMKLKVQCWFAAGAYTGFVSSSACGAFNCPNTTHTFSAVSW